MSFTIAEIAAQAYVASQAVEKEEIFDRHTRAMEGLSTIALPFGLQGKTLPEAPPEHCDGNLDGYAAIYDGRSLNSTVQYVYRGETNPFQDQDQFDDNLIITISKTFPMDSFKHLVISEMPRLIEAFDGYCAAIGMWGTANYIEKLRAGVHAQARQSYSFACDKRWQLGFLEQVHFWDELLCQRLFGFGPEEVMRRLDGQVPLLRPVRDGVYVVFSEKRDISFDEFVEINERFSSL